MTTLEDVWSEPRMVARNGWRALRLALMCGAVALAGCASANPHRFVAVRPAPSVATPMMPGVVTRASRAATAYDRDPASLSAALTYARALREFGSNEAAANILERAAQDHPDNGEVMAEYAKALTASGHNEAALPVFASAEQLNKSDWSLLSAEGIALDQVGKHQQAREKYYTALKLSPGNADVMCNLAFSYSLTGDLTQAEVILRKTVRDPDASAQARQNLAMVVGLQGRFTEAHALARADLDGATADHNVAVMRMMYAQPQLWNVAARKERPSTPVTFTVDAATGAPVAVATSDAPPAAAHAAVASPFAAPVARAATSEKPSGITAAIHPAVAGQAVPSAAKIDAPPAVRPEPGMDHDYAPAKAKPAAVSGPTRVAPAARHRAPAVESDAENEPRQFADGNGVDETVFKFN